MAQSFQQYKERDAKAKAEQQAKEEAALLLKRGSGASVVSNASAGGEYPITGQTVSSPVNSLPRPLR